MASKVQWGRTSLMAFLGGVAAQLALHAFANRPAEAAIEAQIIGQKLYLMTPDRKVRIQAGSYEAGAESGLPMIGLNDRKDRLRVLLRLAGSNESPVLVMKDQQGRDRLVMGLGLNGRGEEPFLITVSADGRASSVFGRME